MAETNAPSRDAMTFSELIAWAYRETPPVHANRSNLLIHLLAVPMFTGGHGAVALGLVTVNGWLIAAGGVSIAISLALQNRGHALEKCTSHPFLNGRDFVRRIYAEQFLNFWRFLFSGGWYAAFKRASG